MSQNIPVYSLPFLYAYGCLVSNNATTPNTKLDVSAGQVRDSNDDIDIVISTSMTINTAVVGYNGLDAGTLAASTVYAVYAIADSAQYNPAGFTLTLASNSAPALPSGYDSYRLVGFATTDSGVHFLKAYTYGNSNDRVCVFDAYQATSVTAGTSATYAAIDLTTIVPPINNMPVTFYINWTANGAGDTFNMDAGNSTGDQWTVIAPVAGGTAHTTAFGTVLAQQVSGAPKVNYKVSAVGGVAIDVARFSYSI